MRYNLRIFTRLFSAWNPQKIRIFSSSWKNNILVTKECTTKSVLKIAIIVLLAPVQNTERKLLSFSFDWLEKIYQTLETVFHRLSKQLGFRQKYSAARRIFNSLHGVWISRCLSCLIYFLCQQGHWLPINYQTGLYTMTWKIQPIRMQESRCMFVSIPQNLPIDQCHSTVSHPAFPSGHFTFYDMV